MRFHLHNSEGTPVDPVPFVVVTLLAVPILIGWAPLYLLEWGVPPGPSVSISVILCVGTGCVAYYRYVLMARPRLRREVPIEYRVRRLLYGIAIGVLILLGLTAATVLTA